MSVRSALQESPETRPKTSTPFSASEPGTEMSAKEFFNTLGDSANFVLTAFSEVALVVS
jgi:hypothetical protein